MAFLVHVCVFIAAVAGTVSVPEAAPLARRDTFLLQMSEVPASPRLAQPAYDAPDLPAPPPINLRAPDWQYPSLRFTADELADATRPVRGNPGHFSPVRPDSGSLSKLAEVSGRTESPEVIDGLDPEYPAGLRRAGVRGLVRVEYVVGLDGRMDPASLRVLYSTHPGFALAAMQALRKARFRPAQRDGHPVAVTVQQIIRFTMQ